MLVLTEKRDQSCYMDFVWEDDLHIRSYRMGLEKVFHGKYLEVMALPLDDQICLLYTSQARKQHEK